MTKSKKSSLLNSINHLESLIRLIKHGIMEDREIPSKQEVNLAIHELEFFRDLANEKRQDNSNKFINKNLHWEALHSLF